MNFFLVWLLWFFYVLICMPETTCINNFILLQWKVSYSSMVLEHYSLILSIPPFNGASLEILLEFRMGRYQLTVIDISGVMQYFLLND